MRTSTPRVHMVVPDKTYKHFIYNPEREDCPQLGIIEILGDLYFGAVNFVEDFISRPGRPKSRTKIFTLTHAQCQ